MISDPLVNADRQRWLDQRQKGIGASEAAALFAMHPYISAFSLWASKVSDRPPLDEDAEDRRADGLLMEPRIAAKYARKTGRQVFDSPGLVQNPAYPYMLATPDRLVAIRSSLNNEPLELKWLDAFRANDEVPVYIQIQQQQQMACLGADIGSIAILGSFRSFHWMDVDINPRFVELLIEKVQEFWQKHVLPGLPPTADGSHATAAALKRLYSHETGETVQLPTDADQWVSDFMSCKVAIKEADERKAEAENKLRAAIGDATYGQLRTGGLLSLKTQTRGAHVVKESTFRVLRFIRGHGPHG